MPPIRISTAPHPNRPKANAPPAPTEISVPITVSRFGFTGRRNRKGSAASSQPSSRSPNLALITTASSSLRGRRRGSRRRLLLRRDLVRHVGKLSQRRFALLAGQPAAAVQHAAIGSQVAQSLVEHGALVPPVW